MFHLSIRIFSVIYLQEGGGEPPKGSLGWAIDSQFGSLEALIQRVNAEGAALQGSGWVVYFLPRIDLHFHFCLPRYITLKLFRMLSSGLLWIKN